jgi:hypothetical protein
LLVDSIIAIIKEDIRVYYIIAIKFKRQRYS